MLKNQNIICISSIDWDFVWQGHQEIMSVFAKNNNKVLFIENTGVRAPNFGDIQRLRKRVVSWFKSIRGFRGEQDNLYVYSPLILPFPYSRIARWFNKRMLITPIKNWMKTMEFHDPIIWTFLPTGTALDVISGIEKKLLVYYCIADFYELCDYKKVKRTEDELIKESDLIFVQGKVLQEKCKRLGKESHIFPFGVRIEAFKNFSYEQEKVPKDLKGIKKPLIGYIGGVHRHIDFELLKFMAKEHPEWSIVLVGPIQTNIQEISSIKNIFLLGKKDFSELPNYINEFDTCLIPYKITEYTDTVYPTKLNEYHALGKPIVSTDLPEVRNFNKENNNLVLVGSDYVEFVRCVWQSLNFTTGDLSDERRFSANKNNWSERIEEMSRIIEATIDEKQRRPLDWQGNLLKLYRRARKHFLSPALIILSTYLLLFYTPLIWFLAKPLKISQKPDKSDCIVVFAGGVGESGRFGQGYEERVERAVELYKNGYAQNLVFSSGYMYLFKEPLVMKALAVSLGVPQEKIITEEKASNTFENVLYSKEILERYGWNKILLVSSPYHMLRTKLIFSKIAEDIEVTFVPIERSLFYTQPEKGGKKINIQQIRGILHEYLGIIYFQLRGGFK